MKLFYYFDWFKEFKHMLTGQFEQFFFKYKFKRDSNLIQFFFFSKNWIKICKKQ